MLDTARFEPLQLPDDLLGRAEQRRVVEREAVRVVPDPGIALGARAARQIADVLQHLSAGGDRPFDELPELAVPSGGMQKPENS
jgi:hypothetical protein